MEKITTDVISAKTGVWYYASRCLLQRYFSVSYDTGHNQHRLVQWLKERNADKITDNDYFIAGSTIVVPADKFTVAVIAGTELAGNAVSIKPVYADSFEIHGHLSLFIICKELIPHSKLVRKADRFIMEAPPATIR